MIKKNIKGLLKIMKDLVLTLYFIMKYILKSSRFKRFKYRKRKSGTITLLANAPSLKEVLPRTLTDEEFRNTDFIVLNYFAFCDEFVKIKPAHYCLADPMFFHKNNRYADVERLFQILQNEVDWKLNIYVPAYARRNFIVFSGLTNPHLNIVPVISDTYCGFECLRNKMYKNNYAMPSIQTVANLAIYVGINSGYDNVRLYGVDHTFFDGLCINDRNELCVLDRHFYDDKPNLKPIIRNDNDEIFKISDYILSIGGMFKSHDLLNSYAGYMGVHIQNCTKVSLIDSYPRV